MQLNLESVDYAVILGGIITAVVAGFVGNILSVTPAVEAYTRFIVAGAVLLTIIFIHQGRTAWDGNLARYLEIIGAGLTILMLSWIPHISWHIRGMPTVFGQPASFWLAFFHILAATSFLIMGYGFYRFWQEG